MCMLSLCSLFRWTRKIICNALALVTDFVNCIDGDKMLHQASLEVSLKVIRALSLTAAYQPVVGTVWQLREKGQIIFHFFGMDQ